MTLDVDGTWFEDREAHPLQIFSGLPPGMPGEYIPIFVSDCPASYSGFGTAAATYHFPAVQGFDWWLGAQIPEPSGLALILAAWAAAGALRRRG